MKILIAICITCILAGLAYAGQINYFSVTPPTMYENGELIPPGGISGYRIYCGPTVTATVQTFNVVTQITGTTETTIASCITSSMLGSYTCSPTSLTPANEESNFGNNLEVVKISHAPPVFITPGLKPRPPYNFRVR